MESRDWSSDVCSSDLDPAPIGAVNGFNRRAHIHGHIRILHSFLFPPGSLRRPENVWESVRLPSSRVPPFLLRLPHLVRYHIYINVYGGAGVRVPHQLLSHSDQSPHGTEQAAIDVPVWCEYPTARDRPLLPFAATPPKCAGVSAIPWISPDRWPDPRSYARLSNKLGTLPSASGSREPSSHLGRSWSG